MALELDRLRNSSPSAGSRSGFSAYLGSLVALLGSTHILVGASHIVTGDGVRFYWKESWGFRGTIIDRRELARPGGCERRMDLCKKYIKDQLNRHERN